MKFKTMDDVDAYYQRQSELRRLRWEARELCNALCEKLEWKHDRQTTERINRVLARARARLARREAYTS